jgi:exodeoxyribonuclease VII large subunit
VALKGEISNFKAHSRGHLYFTIKDESSRISAIMFASAASKLKFEPVDGTKVLIIGKVSVYEANGGYQIYVNDMIEDGVGNLYIEFEKLKKKLEQEGLFDQSKKKPIPKIPKRIGIITAPTGAAIRDIISTIKRRWPLAEVILFPSLVQGEFAKEDIVKQIKRAEDYNLDTLIVGRGGGSIEDLWAFNEEIVARAIYECSIPVISAVGHEIDFTIADFVADMRAPTPTGAAEISVPNLSDVSNLISQINIRLNKAISNKIEFSRRRLLDVKSRHIFKEPIKIYEAKEQKFDFLMEKLKFNILNIYTNRSNSYLKIKENIIFKNPNILFEKKQNDYLRLISKLETLSPLLTIKRGYSISRVNNKVINSVKDVKKKDLVEIELSDGKINAEVV